MSTPVLKNGRLAPLVAPATGTSDCSTRVMRVGGELRNGCVHATLLLGMLLFAFTTLRAAESARDALLFVSDESYPPYTYLDKGVPRGAAVDIIHALAVRLGRPVEIRLMSWDKAQQMVLRGEADALLPMSVTEGRQQQFDFSTTVLDLDFSVFSRSHDAGISSLESLRGLRVAVTDGGVPKQILQSEERVRLRIVQDYAEGFRMLKDGDVDAVVADRRVGGYELARRKITGVRVSDDSIARLKAGAAVRKGNTELLRILDGGLKAMQADGTVDRIIQRWQAQEGIFFTREQVQRWVVSGVIGVLVLLLVAMTVSMRALRREVAERRRAEEDVARLNQRLSVATKSAGIGIWDWDVENDLLIWDEEMYRLYNVRKEDFGGAHEAWAKALHPEDKVRAQNELRAALKGGKPFDTEFRVVWPDGSVRVIQAAAQTFLSESGKPLRMVGVNYDITRRLQAEQAQLKSEEKFAKAFRSSPAALSLTRLATGHFTEVNESMARFLGYSREELIGRASRELGLWIDPADRDRMAKTVAERGSVRDEEFRFRTKQGTEVISIFSAELIEFEGERQILTVLVDTTARKKAEARFVSCSPKRRSGMPSS